MTDVLGRTRSKAGQGVLLNVSCSCSGRSPGSAPGSLPAGKRKPLQGAGACTSPCQSIVRDVSSGAEDVKDPNAHSNAHSALYLITPATSSNVFSSLTWILPAR